MNSIGTGDHKESKKQTRDAGSAITCIVPNYNGKDYILPCLESLLKQTLPLEILVVDDGSRDGSGKIVDDFIADFTRAHPACPSSIRQKKLPRNSGFASAVNAGILASSSPYILLINNDTRAERDLAENLLAAIRSGEKKKHPTFSVQAAMLQMDHPDKMDDGGDLYCILGWAFSPARDKPFKSYQKRAFITTSCAGASLYRRDLLEETGLFDPAHYCYLEDVDLGLRARRYGYRNVYEPRAVLFHKGSATSGSRYNAFKETLSAANNFYLIWKNFPAWMIALNLPFFLLGILIKGIFFAKRGLVLPYLKGLLLGVKKALSPTAPRVKEYKTNFRNDLQLEFELVVNTLRRITG